MSSIPDSGRWTPTIVDGKWLLDRGGLHDARVTSIDVTAHWTWIGIDDEWANERGLSKPAGQACPVFLLFEAATVGAEPLAAMQGGWISEIQLAAAGIFRLVCCDRDVVLLQAASAVCLSPRQPGPYAPRIILFLPISDQALLGPFVQDCLRDEVSLIEIVGENAAEVEDAIDWLIIDHTQDRDQFITTAAMSDETMEDVVIVTGNSLIDEREGMELVRL